MENIKRFIDIGIPAHACNLRCHYCYITQNKEFDQKIPNPTFPPEVIGKSLSKKRLGGICLFNICGNGETLLPKYMIQYTRAILAEGHFVMIVTNGLLTNRIKSFEEFPSEYRERLFFKLSFHYLELKEKNLLDRFFQNVNIIKKMKASFTVEITPTDELIPHIDDIKTICTQKVGALPHITVARDESDEMYPILTKLSLDDYQKTWSSFDSKLFDFKLSIFGKKRNEYCYAGNWSATLNLLTGTMKQCYQTNYFTQIFKNYSKPISFININKCKATHCHNGHAFLCFGSIPEIKTPYFNELRNRVCKDGSEWLQPRMKKFMGTKLEDSNNKETSFTHSIINNAYSLIYPAAIKLNTILKKHN